MVNINGTEYIPGQVPEADWFPLMDAYELAIYEEEAPRDPRDEPAVPGLPTAAPLDD